MATVEVGPAVGKGTMAGVVCAEQDRNRKVKRPRSNPGKVSLNRPVMGRARHCSLPR